MAGPVEERRLPRRDWVLLPLLVVATLLVLAGLSEVAARIAFSEHEQDACQITDPVLGHRPKPDCVSRTKSPEGPWVENRYNNCGYRTPEPCGPKPSSALRVVVLGSSTAGGYMVPYSFTFAARAAATLTRDCRRPVEFQNLGGIGYDWDRVYARLGDALALQPDAAVMVIAPFDLEQPPEAFPTHPVETRAPPPPGMMRRLQVALLQSRAMLAAQHFLFLNPDIYLPLYLRYGDKADFLRQPFSARWQERLETFDQLLGRIAARLHDAGVPLVLVYTPQRAQALLVAAQDKWPTVHPDALGQAIGQIAARDGVIYVNTTDAIGRVPASMFYPVDGHLDGSGHAVIAQQLDAALEDGRVPAFAACAGLRSMMTESARQ